MSADIRQRAEETSVASPERPPVARQESNHQTKRRGERRKDARQSPYRSRQRWAIGHDRPRFNRREAHAHGDDPCKPHHHGHQCEVAKSSPTPKVLKPVSMAHLRGTAGECGNPRAPRRPSRGQRAKNLKLVDAAREPTPIRHCDHGSGSFHMRQIRIATV